MTADRPDDLQALEEDIEHSRRQVGDTVEALAAKLDVKAQTRRRAVRAKDQAVHTTGEAIGKAAAAAATVRAKAGDVTARATRTAKRQRAPLLAGIGAALLAGAWLTWMIRRR